VWAWKPKRAPRMVAYVDHILSVLPFESEVLSRLGGPPVTYVGHSMVSDPGLLRARSAQERRQAEPTGAGERPTILILPGSRSSELTRLLPVMQQAIAELWSRLPGARFILPAVPRHEHRVRDAIGGWTVKPEIVVGHKAKWAAFSEADAAIAASGTVLLELALTGIPCV